MSETSHLVTHSALWSQLGLAHHNWPGRFTLLLATILVLLVTQPMFSGHAFAQTNRIDTVTPSAIFLARR